jgi:RimJ/RimL family protein N-acetyltransferase
MWQRFTERARKVVFYAQEEAQRFGDGYVSTEHLLLGLLREPDSMACRVLIALGTKLATVQKEMEKLLPVGETRPSHDMTLTPRAKRVIDLAYDEARNLNNNYIGTEHVFLGLVREEDGLASRVLNKLGVELERARREVMRLQDSASASDRKKNPDQTWIQPDELVGDFIKLEPLSIEHAQDLAEACDHEMFLFFPVFPRSLDRQGLEDYIYKRIATPLTVAYAIIDQQTNKAIGSSSFFDIRPQDKGLEIGHTWIKREHRGTKVNPETKLLMFGHAFETCGAIRVQQKTDLRNVQSQRAMLKMGCKQEGILRHNMVMPDGYIRDSVYFSVLAEEWPEVKSGLIDRLKS